MIVNLIYILLKYTGYHRSIAIIKIKLLMDLYSIGWIHLDEREFRHLSRGFRDALLRFFEMLGGRSRGIVALLLIFIHFLSG